MPTQDELRTALTTEAGAPVADNSSPRCRARIAERAVNNFLQADGDFGRRLDAAVQALRG